MADHHDPCSGEGRTHWLACPCREAKAEALAEALRPFVEAFQRRTGGRGVSRSRRDWNERLSGAWPVELAMVMEDGRRARAALAAWEGKGEGRG